jgi:hypothetical protein
MNAVLKVEFSTASLVVMLLEHQTFAALGRPKFALVNIFKDIFAHVRRTSKSKLFFFFNFFFWVNFFLEKTSLTILDLF